ncbi:hypothetical protein Strvi_3717 [Streptomyces violaceusniger Tu 4113]|uniref:DUF7848 domain-containing protein n=1 Tax=Streptomyces violaceusniger (strain Tu 4113) TaxID=653045 RepID=G2NTM4_STRV4|nr:hypothetical protein Strvi_3717 [Streptomyces violaceusniger Tu 4113]
MYARKTRQQGAPDGIYLAECMTCPATSGRVDGNLDPVAHWAILHTEQQGLNHSQFLVTVERHWRVDPVRTPGRYGTDTLPPTRTVSTGNRTPATHCAPGSWGTRCRHAMAWLGRSAGTSQTRGDSCCQGIPEKRFPARSATPTR